MPKSDFAGSTATNYRKFRRDVGPQVLDALAAELGLGRADRVLDLGAGTGQLAVPLAARVGAVVAMDPEPRMLAGLRDRMVDERLSNVLCVLGSDADLGAVQELVGQSAFGAVTIGNALHWMDAPMVFDAALQMTRPGGGIAIVTQGPPLWLSVT